MTASQETQLFLQFNYARWRQFRILRPYSNRTLPPEKLTGFAKWAHMATGLRDHIVEANLPLVFAMLRRFHAGTLDLDEMVSEGSLTLLHCVDQFDCTQGYKFCTYACAAIRKSFARVGSKSQELRRRFLCACDAGEEPEDPGWQEQRHQDLEEVLSLEELHHVLLRNGADLSETEWMVVAARFGLDQQAPQSQPQTLAAIGGLIRLTRERVRQIQNQALAKLRQALIPGPCGR